MSAETKGILYLCGVCCLYPGIVAALAILAYRRYQSGGWRSVLFGDKTNNDTTL